MKQADNDDNKELSFEEACARDRIACTRTRASDILSVCDAYAACADSQFITALPTRVSSRHPTHKLREWFDLADQDGDGSISMAEFMQWSIMMTRVVTGVGILKIMQFDDDKPCESGLDEMQFTKFARTMGFGPHASELYTELPLRSDETIDIEALAAMSRMPDKVRSQRMRDFLMAMSWNSTADVDEINTSGWSFDGDTPESARAALGALLREKQVKLSQVFEKIDVSSDVRIV